jgi:hypothetical protein
MISIAPPWSLTGAATGRGRAVAEGRVIGGAIDGRFVVDGAAGTDATVASVVCVVWTVLGSRGDSVERSIRGSADLVDATGATGAAVGGGAGTDTGSAI